MKDGSRERGKEWVLAGLAASGPDPELKAKLMLFGQFVGDWAIDARYPQADGTERTGKGSLHVRWILDGRAVQDVWTTREDNPPRDVAAGTTVRFYDSKLDAWHCVWISPPQNAARMFIARERGDEIVLEGSTSVRHLEQWIFSEITPQSFRWRAVESDDHRKTWRLTEEMRIRRLSER